MDWFDSDIQVPTEIVFRVKEDVKPQIDFEEVPEAQMVVSVVNNSTLTVSQFKELEQSVCRINHF